MKILSETNYKGILEKLIQQGYQFIGFDYEIINSGTKFVLWRHDVDHSLNRAYRLAEIEEEFGIKATYFIHIQSGFITCLSRINMRYYVE